VRLTGLTVAVTGASGFCGAAVATAAAAHGADVICLARTPGPAGRHVRWDATRETPDLTGADAVIHLAAAVGDPGRRPAAEQEFRAVNVDGAERLLAAANGRPVVWVSSASVYDPRVSRRHVREDHPVAAQLNAYGRSKAAGDRLARAYGAVVLRPHAVYGPGDRYLLPRLRRIVRAGVLPLPGPDVRISLTAVENLADVCLAALGWPPGPYNIADAADYSRDAAITEVFAALGQRMRIAHVPVRLANAAADAVEFLNRLGSSGEPALTRYAVDQMAHDMVLDLSKAAAQGFRPRRALRDYLATLR
jgi:2-alkyl-3-oxoalkanoate reductase